MRKRKKILRFPLNEAAAEAAKIKVAITAVNLVMMGAVGYRRRKTRRKVERHGLLYIQASSKSSLHCDGGRSSRRSENGICA